MAIVVHLKKSYRKWCTDGTVFVTGAAFKGSDELLTAELLCNALKNVSTCEDFVKLIDSINGFFACVVNKGNQLFAAVDRIRSIPIFYTLKEGHIYISDDAEWLRNEINDNKFDVFSEQEMLLTGYVTRESTLFPNIKQLQAGEYLFFKMDGKEPSFVREYYFRYFHENLLDVDNCHDLFKELDVQLESAMHRLIGFASGRQIVIPLSAGYDSRSIALMLGRLKYKNVLCFSYGIKENDESETSRKVANYLQFKWVFVEYSEDEWRTWWNTEERKEYFQWAANWSSFAITQDWAAVWMLKKRGVIDKNAVFVPGHTPLSCEQHIPVEVKTLSHFDESMLLQKIFCSHYHLVDYKKLGLRSNSFLDKMDIMSRKVFDGFDYADSYQEWEYRERQAKFIVNNTRVYEFWGFDWWLPLFDVEFCRFWLKMPLNKRIGKVFFIEYVDRFYESIIKNTDAIPKQIKKKTFLSVIRLKLKRKFVFGTSFLPGRGNVTAPYGKYSTEIIRKFRSVVKKTNGFGAIQYIHENLRYSSFLKHYVDRLSGHKSR